MSANASTASVAAVVEKTAEKAKETAPSTVEAITEAVKNTSIASKNEAQPKVEVKAESKVESKAEPEPAAPAAEPKVESKVEAKVEKPDISEADAAHALSAAEGRRLYIGNLAYSTTDEQLKEFFQGFSIESTSIPTNPRTGKAVGYAFVDLTTKEEADRAIEGLSGQEVQERKVSVQLARKPGYTGNGIRKEPAAVVSEEEGAAHHEGEHPHPKKGRGGSRNRGRGRAGRGSKRGTRGEHSPGEEEEASAAAHAPGNVLAESTNVQVEPVHEAAISSGSHHDGFVPTAFKSKKKRGPPENGIPSSTKIMVANLPYELSEEKLKELFKDYQPESAKIALRPIPRYMVRKLQARGEPRKGRGFGFVNLASEEMQKKAVEEMNGKMVDGREIAVKVAIDSQTSDSEDKENVGEEGQHTEEKNVAVEAQNGVKVEPEVATA